jgi:Holliday junction resolvasome RuvABC ATP-dependent DNA helicase subunit
MRGRLRMIELRPYAHDDLVEIIRRAAARVGRAIASEAAAVLAKAAGGNPRNAVGLYAEARAHADVQGGGSITVDDARNALRLAELGQDGTGPVHRRILDVLRWSARGR